MSKPDITTLFRRFSGDLLNRFEHSNRGRADEIGMPREAQIREFLRSVLPEKYGVTKGYVINLNKDISDECDVIIYSRESCPKFVYIPEGDVRLVPIEETLAVIEVKSTLNVAEFSNALRKMDSVVGVHENSELDEAEFAPRSVPVFAGQPHASAESRTREHRKPLTILFTYRGSREWYEERYDIERSFAYSSIDALIIFSEGCFLQADHESVSRSHSRQNRTPLALSRVSADVYNEMTRRYIRSDEYAWQDSYVFEADTHEDALVTLYTLLLDGLAVRFVPNYTVGDYLALWYQNQRNASRRSSLKREIEILVNIIEPDPERRPVVNKHTKLLQFDCPPGVIRERIRAYCGADLAVHADHTLKRCVTTLRENCPEWPA